MPAIFMAAGRERIKMLLEMENIKPEDQETLWRLGTNVGLDEAKRFADQLEAAGGRYKYTVQEVNSILGKRKPLWKQLLGL